MTEPASSDASDRVVFDLLSALAGDGRMAEIFSELAAVESWLRVEASLARAEAEVGLIPAAASEAIVDAARPELIDRPQLWAQARNVGYPILPLVRQLDALLPEEHRGYVHVGATTQDIMDSGLALQLAAATKYLRELLTDLGNVFAELCQDHCGTVLPGRTHALHAVPTTWGAKLAVYLAEFTRHRRRLDHVASQVAVVSLFGAGGTSAALGPDAAKVRSLLAADLDLAAEDVPWHVARDRVAEWGHTLVTVAGSAARLAREVVDLSRNEIGEVAERSGHHRGASSTMPQKTNPITSETVIGSAVAAGALAASLARLMEAGHERAAGEWQAEWFVLPRLAGLTASALRGALDIVSGLRVDADAMRRNLTLDHGLIMSEAWMMKLAPTLGRERAHDLVYQAAQRARHDDIALAQALVDLVDPDLHHLLDEPLSPEQYVGDPGAVVQAAVTAWQDTLREGESS